MISNRLIARKRSGFWLQTRWTQRFKAGLNLPELSSNHPNMEQHCPRRPAFGQTVAIGTLYDARNECFLFGSIFDKGLQLEQITIQKTTCKVVDNDTYKDNFKSMGVGNDFGASIIAGLVVPDCAGRVLHEKSNSRNILSAAIHHEILTVREKLVPASSGIGELGGTSFAGNSNATHIVMEVEWGAQSTVLVRSHSVKSKLQLQAQTQALQEAVETGHPIIEGNPAWLVVDDPRVDVMAFSDILNDGILMSNTQKFQEACEFLSVVPAHIKQENSGKGNPGMHRV